MLIIKAWKDLHMDTNKSQWLQSRDHFSLTFLVQSFKQCIMNKTLLLTMVLSLSGRPASRSMLTVRSQSRFGVEDLSRSSDPPISPNVMLPSETPVVSRKLLSSKQLWEPIWKEKVGVWVKVKFLFTCSQIWNLYQNFSNSFVQVLKLKEKLHSSRFDICIIFNQPLPSVV